MAAVLKLRKIGNSLGIILPKETTDRLHVSDGDELTMVETDNGIEISPYDPSFETKLKAFEKSRRKYRNALRQLAKQFVLRITWLDRQDIVQYHAELIAEHGGLQGPPNEGALDSTLARPRSYLAYNPRCSVFELAARYGFGFARNHSFPDGNKRLALVTIDVFLMANGYELTATEVEAVATITSLAAGEVTEDQLAEWIEANAHPLAA